jgi:DNA-binding response OmpR family regulator
MAHSLVVEDERQLAALISRPLTVAGHSVGVAEDGVTALELLERIPAERLKGRDLENTLHSEAST